MATIQVNQKDLVKGYFQTVIPARVKQSPQKSDFQWDKPKKRQSKSKKIWRTSGEMPRHSRADGAGEKQWYESILPADVDPKEPETKG